MMTATEVRLEEILLDPAGPKVVALGGGHGLAITLEALQSYASEITAVVAVADDGGSSGRLTTGLGMPPPGDLRRCLLALTPEPSIWSELFAYRFSGGDIEDHSLGNLLLAALTDLTGDFASASDMAGQMLGAVGRVVPAANQPAVLQATVGGQELTGQTVISKARGGVSSFRIGPEGLEAHADALHAIGNADQIVIGPGSLYTSLLAVLMVPGIAEAVMASNAGRVFVLNLIYQDGETLGMSGAQHLAHLGEIGGVKGPGAVVVNGSDLRLPPSPPVPVLAVRLDDEDAMAWGWSVRRADVVDHGAEWPEHEPLALGAALSKLL
ncbi:MAG: gluconeogenesis factor YvcK family protein [Acidimicrobiia bacterium]